MQRVHSLASLAPDLQQFIHIFNAIHLLDISGNYIVEARRLRPCALRSAL
jgi:hypothetical protein